ncbi:MAG: MerR family transcriptional regulator [Erythrobacter sp.]
MSATFDDGKDAGALRTIGEVGDALGIKQHVLRYWEQQFPMLRPLKRSGGRRYYRPEDVALVETIDRLVNREGYTLKGARAAIREGKAQATAKTPGATPPQAAAASLTSAPDILPQLKAIRNRLAAALAG